MSHPKWKLVARRFLSTWFWNHVRNSVKVVCSNLALILLNSHDSIAPNAVFQTTSFKIMLIMDCHGILFLCNSYHETQLLKSHVNLLEVWCYTHELNFSNWCPNYFLETEYAAAIGNMIMDNVTTILLGFCLLTIHDQFTEK